MTGMIVAVLLGASFVGCGGSGAGAGESRRPVFPVSAAPAPVITPVPETLTFDAGRFGLTMTGEDWTWKVLRRNLTRFDWSGRPTKGDRELLYSFWMDKLDEPSTRSLPRIVGAAAANLSETEPCPPVEQPPEVVRALGVDRVISVCFEPSPFYGKDFRSGMLHGIVHEGALTLAVVLSNDRVARAPLPSAIGARGSARSR